MLGMLQFTIFSVADDRTAETTVYADAGFSETTVLQVAARRRRQWFCSGDDCLRVAAAETTVRGGGRGDGGRRRGDDSTRAAAAETAVGVAETTVLGWRLRRRRISGGDAGLQVGDDSLPGGSYSVGGDVSLQAQTTKLWRRQFGDAKLRKPSFGGRRRQSGSRRRQSESRRRPNCGDDSSSAQTTLCVSRNAGRRVLGKIAVLVVFLDC